MGLQAIFNALHQTGNLRVDIDYSEYTQLTVRKLDNDDVNFEIYPPLGILFITEDINRSAKWAEYTFLALPRNPYAKSLQEMLTDSKNSDENRKFLFSKYSKDTRSLCRFLITYFSFVEPCNSEY